MSAFFSGIDFGTSGARICVIDAESKLVFEATESYTLDLPASWLAALMSLVNAIPITFKKHLASVALCGTSGTLLLTDDAGRALSAALLYNDARATAEAKALGEFAPAHSIVLAANSSLAKLHWLIKATSITETYCAHQADWLGQQLHGQPRVCDYHNALKLGYDVENLRWPAWLRSLNLFSYLPKIVSPGAVVGPVTPALAARLQINPACMVRAGTTDSIAAFIASGAHTPDTAVSSLGSTLALKVITPRRIEDSEHGVYSHRWGRYWLAGGASNSGGNVLKAFFSDQEIECLSATINPQRAAPYVYYPLLSPGERFPTNDPAFLPVITPRPDAPAEFLHCLLEGIARIEARGYALLESLGVHPIERILSAGKGGRNPVFSAIREKLTRKTIHKAKYDEAAYGAALLAQRGERCFITERKKP